MRWVIVTLGLALGACSSSYQDLQGAGLFDGVDSERVSDTTFRIVAKGSMSSSVADMHDFMLLKAAQTTKLAGGTHFVVIADAGDTRSVSGGNRRAHQDVYIKIFTLEPKMPPPSSAMSADEVIQTMNFRVPS